MWLGDGECAESISARGHETISLEINVLGEPVHLRINAVRSQFRLADIVPLARMVCGKITNAVLEVLNRDGCKIPCARGCWACCRYLVPLSIPEVFRLNKEVLARPVFKRRQMQQACLLAAKHILENSGPQIFVNRTMEGNIGCPTDLEALSRWYAGLNLTCPFLDEGVCSIYGQRPLACREYFIIGSPDVCAGKNDAGKRVTLPVRMSEVLGRLTAELEGAQTEAIILPFSLVWAQQNRERDERVWPGQMMVEKFMDIVTEMASNIALCD